MPHRDIFPDCPTCGIALNPYGTRLGCPSCRGCLIQAAELEELLDQTSPDDVRPLARRLFPGTAPPRGCPICAAAMTAHVLYGITLDRCAVHGIWFDRDELAAALLANGEAYAERQPAVGRSGASSAFAERGYLAALAKHIERTTPP